MSIHGLSKYSAKIKNVYVELKKYKFFHSPYFEGDERFIGRDKVKNRIITILKNTNSKSGAYLVTGFRGMGKTSVLREAIEDYNDEIEEERRKKIEDDNKTKLEEVGILPRRILPWINKRIVVCLLTCLYIMYLLYGFSYDEIISNWFTSLILSCGFFILICFFIRNKEHQYRAISDIIWQYFKLFLIVFIVVLFMLYFQDPHSFCNKGVFHCFPINARWDQIVGQSSGFSIYRVLFSILFSYGIVSLVLSINDLLVEFLPSLGTKKGKKKEEHQLDQLSKYQSFEINLSQKNLNEIDVLRRMTINLHDYWLLQNNELNSYSFSRKLYFFWKFLLSIVNLSRKSTNRYEPILARIERLKSRISGQVTSRRELNVNPNISAGIQGGLAKLTTPLGQYSNKDEVSYPIATPKEVEDELVGILKDIAEMRKNSIVEIPEFIFIIDELDKIGPHTNSSVEEKELSNPTFDNQFNAQELSQFRQRQEAVASLLANLKGFLNVIRAKFFFIGGREMFDADLADIADRDSFYSSVFNDVIYIESFFKDSKHSGSGVTQMTEMYLCNIILNSLELEKGKGKGKAAKKERQAKKEKQTLKSLYENIQPYNKREKNISLLFKKSNTNKNTNESISERREQLELSKDETKRQAYKTMFTLQNYVIYLNYRSNGTPKKLTALTEQLIKCGPSRETYNSSEEEGDNYKFLKENIVLLHDSEKDVLTTDLSQRLFLHFDFNTQYEIGLTANLYRPYLIANSRHLKLLGDKLLFSSSFIIDHLLKFHPFGFSWKNLEHIPEIILVNREPNLRRYIEDLMRFYSLAYVKDTVSGLFELKFRSVVKRELIYASKTSDLSSAAFNFTLDESFPIKRHYKKKLLELRQKYKNYFPVKDGNQFVNSLYFVQTILGDLYFYDKEYDESILYYQESIQSLQFPNRGRRPITKHQFVLLLKTKLKLGLTFEKMRDFDSALSFYKTSISDIKEYLGNKEGRESDPLDCHKIDENNRTAYIVNLPYIALLAGIEKARYDGITYANLLLNRKEFKNIISIEGEGKEKYDEVDAYRRYFQLADYYNNVGSILYYKNCQFSRFFEEDADRETILLEVFEEEKEQNELLMRQRVVYDKKPSNRPYDFFPSLVSFNYYWNSLHFLLKEHKNKIIKHIGFYNAEVLTNQKIHQNYLVITTGLLLPENIDLINSNRFYYIANVVSKIGDCVLSCLKKNQCLIPTVAFEPLSIIDYNKEEFKYRQNLSRLIEKFNMLYTQAPYQAETVLYIYQLAAALYMRAGQNYYYSFQLKKILYLIKDLIEINRGDIIKDRKYLERLKIFLIVNEDKENPFEHLEEIATHVFKATTWNNEVANRPQILKYREILGIKNRSEEREYIYNNINNVTDNREVVLLVEGIKMKLKLLYPEKEKSTGWKKYFKNFGLSKSIISAYNSMNNRFLRILELKYRSERCYFITKEFLEIEEVFKSSSKVEFKGHDDDQMVIIKNRIGGMIGSDLSGKTLLGDIFVFLIREALFCLRELIKMIKLYDPGYVIGYSYIAEAHSRMGDWCHARDNFIKILKFYALADGVINEEKKGVKDKASRMLKEFEKDIKDLLGGDSLAYLESKNHYESAMLYYFQVIGMHTEGKSYRDQLPNLYMLEDDYNDNSTHFAITAERFRVNTGNIREKIIQLNEKIGKSRVYEYSSYIHSDDRPEGRLNDTVREKLIRVFTTDLSGFEETVQ